MGTFSFSKKERLLKRREFLNLHRFGDRHYTKHFICILKQNGLHIKRLGVTASKKTGSAVIRNRIKRLIREFFRLNKGFLPEGYDILIIAKKNAINCDLWTIEEEIGEIVFVK